MELIVKIIVWLLIGILVWIIWRRISDWIFLRYLEFIWKRRIKKMFPNATNIEVEMYRKE